MADADARARSAAQVLASRRNLINYHNLRREHVGNIGICCFAALRSLHLVALGRADVPANLRGVTYWTEETQDGLLHFIQGIDILARAIVTKPDSYATHGAYLTRELKKYGMIQHVRSAMFDVSTAIANQLYRDNNSVFVIFHRSILTLRTTDAIRALRVGFFHIDQNYRRENKPGFYIGVDNEKLTQRAAVQILGGGTAETARALRALKTRYIQGGREPVDEVIQGQMVTVRT